jgi:chromosome segregation ATPase
LNRKESKIRDLQAQYDDLNAKDATLDQDVETHSREVRRLRQQNDNANEQVRRLTAKLEDARSGGNELGRIKGLLETPSQFLHRYILQFCFFGGLAPPHSFPDGENNNAS